MKILIASDHAGFEMKKLLVEFLKSEKYDVEDMGTNSLESVDYPDYAQKLCRKLLSNKDEYRGILICGTGVGMSIAANRYRGIRAALCHHSQIARLSVQHDGANILCLGERMIGGEVAKECAREFLSAKFEGGRHERRIGKIEDFSK
jgi:ribose 5-phosphate isomerase B